jgi:5'-nucleotidase (lipoprotein e(P4) family)
MNGKKYLLTFALVFSSIVSTYFVTASTAQQGAQPATADNEYQVAAILYMQKAGEYRALAYQAFNVARMQFDMDFEKKNLKKLPKAERKRALAVVVDVDETVLDNSPHQAEMVKNRMPFTNSVWTAWVNRRAAKPIAGAVEFLNYANQKGARIFYVTNRNEAEKQGTIDNLKQAGFPDVSDETVMVRATESSKEARRLSILQIISTIYQTSSSANRSPTVSPKSIKRAKCSGDVLSFCRTRCMAIGKARFTNTSGSMKSKRRKDATAR